MSTPGDGKTPSAPDVDQPDGGGHSGAQDDASAGRTPDAPDVDEPDGGAHAGPADG